MRTTLRSLALGLAAAAASALSAQYPYTLVVQGTIAGCVPFQQVNIATVGGVQPSYNYTLEVFPEDCFYDTILTFNSTSATISVSTMCNGMVVTAYDSVAFNFIGDTAVMTIDLFCNGGGTYDCAGVLNGPNVPGAACNDGDPATINDTWDANCICVGTAQPECQASFTVSNSSPWVMNLDNTSTGMMPMLYGWTLPDGSTTGQNSPYFGFSEPGTYGVCLQIVAWDNCTSTFCDTVYVDENGTVTTVPDYYDCMGYPNGPNVPGSPCDDNNPNTLGDVWDANCGCSGQGGGDLDCLGVPDGGALPGTACVYTPDSGNTWLTGIWSMNCECLGDTNMVYDCNGVLNGPDMPGTPCITFFGTPGTWSPACVCVANSNTFDCLGILNGPNMPGTACDDGDPATLFSWWSADCVCTADTGGTMYDCLQIPNGPNMPGTSCVIPGTTIEGIWSADCVCIPDSTEPCQADFWVLQAYGQDSLPVPYELWVWNLSSGGSGIYSYSWDFGDGTSSTDPYPTHTYDGNGPYVLCLTLNDLNGCTSIHCDSISIDGDGMYNGMTGGEGDRQDGFTINVQNPAANGVQELGLDEVVLWPNPVADELNVAVNGSLRGTAIFTVIDMNGRVVLNERHALTGRTQLRFATDDLESGLYTLRIDDGTRNLSNLRFVRMH